MDVKKRWVPLLSRPFLKAHFIAIVESEMGGRKDTAERGKGHTRGGQENVLPTWDLLDDFPSVDCIPLAQFRTEAPPKLPPLFSGMPRWREGSRQKPDYLHLSDRKHWELLTSSDSSHGGADVRRMPTAWNHMSSQISELLAPDPGFNSVWLNHLQHCPQNNSMYASEPRKREANLNLIIKVLSNIKSMTLFM